MKRRARFLICIFALGGAGLALRLPRLELRPMHVDEAVHADKFHTLWQAGRYVYDLNEYHGPTLYYFTLPAIWLTGVADYAHLTAAHLRIVAVVFGTCLILLLVLLADGLGRWEALWAGGLAAVSPALTYYSRYYIQESLLVFFTCLMIGAGWRYLRTRRAGWAFLAGMAVGFMHATKETCIIAIGSALLALAITAFWYRRRAPAPVASRRYLASRALLAAAIGAGIVSVPLFSGFFVNWAGPVDSIRAFATYFQRAADHGVHQHPWHYYLHLLTYWRAGAGPIWSEGLIVGLALLGLVAALRGRIFGKSVWLLRFIAIYVILITVVYSLIPYKTPWCMLSALHGMTLLAGTGAVALVRMVRSRAAQAIIAAGLIGGAGQLAWQARRANSFKYCASERNPYVYAQTLHSVVDLADWLRQIAALHPAGRDMVIKVMVENCWPLPWYLRDFGRVGYWEGVPQSPEAEAVIASSRYQAELERRLSGRYEVHNFGLRRDERLVVYIRQELWDSYLRHMQAAGQSTRKAGP